MDSMTWSNTKFHGISRLKSFQIMLWHRGYNFDIDVDQKNGMLLSLSLKPNLLLNFLQVWSHNLSVVCTISSCTTASRPCWNLTLFISIVKYVDVIQISFWGYFQFVTFEGSAVFTKRIWWQNSPIEVLGWYFYLGRFKHKTP